MSQTERTGARDLLYSSWHRSRSLSRFVSARDAFGCATIDIDWCEWCAYCHKPVALIETQRSTKPPKEARVTLALARMAGIDCFSVSYVATAGGQDIERFRVRSLEPPQSEIHEMEPAEYAAFLCGLRIGHECVERAA